MKIKVKNLHDTGFLTGSLQIALEDKNIIHSDNDLTKANRNAETALLCIEVIIETLCQNGVFTKAQAEQIISKILGYDVVEILPERVG